jgi:hypothetical protein
LNAQFQFHNFKVLIDAPQRLAQLPGFFGWQLRIVTGRFNWFQF